ncbi:hypothetical protein RJT34_25096 [Clitoria ternatea]|uniref:BHLH domain-containing protein n=1 Tax=Clitoria ternatea TaxID=43366 RepID=A0AAN9FPB1_CLITE
MFPLQRGNELVFQFSNNGFHHQHKISQDLILDHDHHHDKKLRTSQPNELFYGVDETNNEYTKKMVHRDLERQRRQEMATLHTSLRSLFPLEFIKGKRTLSDQINVAVNYINHLQKNIKELSDKRDELKKLSNIPNLEKSHETKHASSSTFTLHHNNGAVEIEISSGFKEEGPPLSKLLELLLEEGLEVVNCLSTQVNGRLLHSLQCEVNNSDSVDPSELRRKISNLSPSP